MLIQDQQNMLIQDNVLLGKSAKGTVAQQEKHCVIRFDAFKKNASVSKDTMLFKRKPMWRDQI